MGEIQASTVRLSYIEYGKTLMVNQYDHMSGPSLPVIHLGTWHFDRRAIYCQNTAALKTCTCSAEEIRKQRHYHRLLTLALKMWKGTELNLIKLLINPLYSKVTWLKISFWMITLEALCRVQAKRHNWTHVCVTMGHLCFFALLSLLAHNTFNTFSSLWMFSLSGW